MSKRKLQVVLQVDFLKIDWVIDYVCVVGKKKIVVGLYVCVVCCRYLKDLREGKK